MALPQADHGTGRAGAVALLRLLPFPMVGAGADLAGVVAGAAAAAGVEPRAGDILVVAQKIVSKAEGRMRPLADVAVGAEAAGIAARCGKDPRLVALVLSEARAVLRVAPDVLIVETRQGQIVANAGIDQSNIGAQDGEAALLLPDDPDASARALRAGLAARWGVAPGVIVADSFGRPWRRGTTGVAIGVAGPPMVEDLRGRPDLFGRKLRSSETGFADAVAAAAVLVMGEADEGCPAVILRGLSWPETEGRAADGLRPPATDLFR